MRLLSLAALSWSAIAAAQPLSGSDAEVDRTRLQFEQEVDRRLDVPVVDR